MPLNFTFEFVAPGPGTDEWEQLTTAPFLDEGRKQWHPIAKLIVDLSMICGFNEISEKNYEKVWRRIAQFEQIRGKGLLLLPPQYVEIGDQTWVTKEDVRKLIGFRSNASTMTDAEWNKKLVLMLNDDLDRRVRYCNEMGSLYDTINKYAQRVSAETGREIVNLKAPSRDVGLDAK